MFTLGKEMGIEVADFDSLLAFRAESNHFTGSIKMLVSEVIVLESFVI